MVAASVILIVVCAYLALGVVFAIAFVSVGVARVDRAAMGAPWSFRLLILPGCVALWPVLLRKWAGVRRGGGA